MHGADEHIEEDTEKVKQHMISELSLVTGIDINNPPCCELHRWRYANIVKQSGSKYLIDKNYQLAACGDWCIHGRVESAFISANELSRALVNII